MDPKTLKHLEDLNLFFEAIGFDDTTKKDHLERITKIIFASVSEKLDRATGLKDKAEFPEIKSIHDFYDYYEQYIDKATIEKIVKEETHGQFSEYFEAIHAQLPK